jgi:hypothetical protein
VIAHRTAASEEARW